MAIHSSRRSHFLKKIFFKSGIRTQVLLTTLKTVSVLQLPKISNRNLGGEGGAIYLVWCGYNNEEAGWEVTGSKFVTTKSPLNTSPTHFIAVCMFVMQVRGASND